MVLVHCTFAHCKKHAHQILCYLKLYVTFSIDTKGWFHSYLCIAFAFRFITDQNSLKEFDRGPPMKYYCEIRFKIQQKDFLNFLYMYIKETALPPGSTDFQSIKIVWINLVQSHLRSISAESDLKSSMHFFTRFSKFPLHTYLYKGTSTQTAMFFLNSLKEFGRELPKKHFYNVKFKIL